MATLQSLENIDAATNAWLEEGADLEGSYYFLRDEVEAVLASRWKPSRKRLREAMKVIRRG